MPIEETSASLPFDRIDQIYKEAQRRSPAFAGMSLRDFAQFANEATGTQAFEAGNVGAFGAGVKRASAGLDRLIRPVTDTTKEWGQNLGSLIGPKTSDVMGSVFEGAPRMLAETAAVLPAAAAIAGTSEVTIPLAALAALGLTSAGASGYEKTGSALQGLGQAASLAVMPAGGSLGTRAALPIAQRAGSAVERIAGPKLAGAVERAIEYAGANVGASVASEVPQFATQAVTEGVRPALNRTFSQENLIANTVGQIPFSLFDIGQLRGYRQTPKGVEPAGITGPVHYRSLVEANRVANTADSVVRAVRNAQVQKAVEHAAIEEQVDQVMEERQKETFVPEKKATVAKAEEKKGRDYQLRNDPRRAENPMYGTLYQKLEKADPSVTGDEFLMKANQAYMKGLIRSPGDLERFAKDPASFGVVEGGEKNGQEGNEEEQQKEVLDLQAGPAGQHKAEQFELPLPREVFALSDLAAGGGLFGLTGVEQTRAPKPFGISKTKEGRIPVSGLAQRMKAVLPKAEWDLYEKAGIGEFLKKGNADPAELSQWMQENGPKVEIRKLEANQEVRDFNSIHEERQAERSRTLDIRHRLETVDSGKKYWTENPDGSGLIVRPDAQIPPVMDEEIRQLVMEYNQRLANWSALNRQMNQFGAYGQQNDSATANYTQVNPKPLEAMPGAVDILVRVPVSDELKKYGGAAAILNANANVISAQSLPIEVRNKAEEEVKYYGPHFESSDINILAFARGYFETLPDGRKVFHVFEVQSDWAKAVSGKEAGADPHPLLADYNRLALKAAVRHALDNGATHIAVSDAETAMLTEEHDRNQLPSLARPVEVGKWVVLNVGNPQTPRRYWEAFFDSAQEADKFIQTNFSREVFKVHQVTEADTVAPPLRQEKGMRLNYDQELPKILRELTGDEGHPVDFGEHQNATERDDLYFKNKDGTPKTNITARIFSLDKAGKVLAERLGFSFFSKDQVQSFLRSIDKLGASPDEILRAQRYLENVVSTGGSLDDALWNLYGQDPSAFREGGDLLASTDAFMRETFRAKGWKPEEVDFAAGIANRIAAMFYRAAPKANVMRAKGQSNFALEPTFGRNNPIVALLESQGAERFGKDAELTRTAFVLGHELTHIVKLLSDSRPGDVPEDVRTRIQEAHLEAETMTPAEMSSAIVELMRTVMQDTPLRSAMEEQVRARYTGGNVEEFIADYGSLVVLNRLRPLDFQGHTLLLNKTSFRFLRSIARYFGSIVDSVSRTLKKAFGIPEGSLEKIRRSMEGIVETADRAESITSAYLAAAQKSSILPHVPEVSSAVVKNWDYWGLSQLAPGPEHQPTPRWLDELVGEVEGESRPVGKPAAFGNEIKPWHMFYSAVQLSRRFPMLKDAVDLGLSYFGISAQKTQAMWAPWNDANGRLDLALFKKLSGKTSKETNAAFNYADLLQQASEQPLRGLDLRIELQRKFPGIKDEVIETVEQGLMKKAASMHEAANTRIAALQDDIAASVGSVLMGRDRGMNWSTADMLSKAVVSATVAGRRDLATRALLDGRVDPRVAEKIVAMAEANMAGIEKVKHSLYGADGARPEWYGPTVFSGKYGVSWREASETRNSYVAFETRKQAQKKLDELNERRMRGEVVWVKTIEKVDEGSKYHLLQQDFVEAYKEADKIRYQSALAALEGEDPVLVQEIVGQMQNTFQPGDGMDVVTTSPYMLPREGNPAVGELDMFKAMTRYLDATAFMSAKRWVKQRQRLILQDPELRANPNLRSWATRYLTSLTNPEGKEWTKTKNFIFMHYLGANISSLFIEGTQGFMTLVPHLVSKGATLREGYAEFLRGMKDAVPFLSAGSESRRTTGDRDLDALIKKAAEMRVVESGFVQELYNLEDVAFAQERHLQKEEGTLDKVVDLPRNVGYHLLRGARMFYSVSQKANALGALIASYRWAKKSGMSVEAAGNFAIDSVHTTMFGGGLANRPAFSYGIGKAQGVVGVALSLQNYMFNMVSMMGRTFSDAIGRSPWINEAQRKQARKSLGLMLGTQVAFGGVLGLPFIGGLMALVEQMFPESEIQKNLRETMFNLSSDPAVGQMIAEGAMSGLGNVAFPVADLGARFQLGQFLGVDPYKGFSWENLFGPAGAMMKGWVSGIQDLRRGDVAGFAQRALPAGLRGPSRLLAEQGIARDSAGRMLFELSPTEQALLATGFRPQRLSHYQQQAQMQRKSEEVLADNQRRFVDQLSDLLLAGKFPEARAALAQRAREHPTGFSVTEAVESATALAVEKSLPTSPLEDVSRLSADEAARTQQMLGRQPRATQSEIVQKQAELKRLLGVPGTLQPSPRKIVDAQRLDSMLQEYPYLTRTQARVLLEQRQSPRRFRQAYPEFRPSDLAF